MSGSNDRSQEREAMLEVPVNLHGLFLVEPQQATYIIRLHTISRETADGQCGNDLHLEVTCIFVLAAAGFQELREIFDFASLIYWLPVKVYREGYEYTQATQATTQHGEVFNAEAQAQRRGFRAAMWRMGTRHKTGKNFRAWKLHQASRMWKAICVCVIVLPRLLICGALIRFGSGFLVNGEEEKMIVDTVASLFVLEIGGFIFSAFITNEVKNQLAATEDIKIVTSHWHRMAEFVSVHFLYPLVCLGFAVGMVYSLRQDCSDEETFFSTLMNFKSWEALWFGDIEK